METTPEKLEEQSKRGNAEPQKTKVKRKIKYVSDIMEPYDEDIPIEDIEKAQKELQQMIEANISPLINQNREGVERFVAKAHELSERVSESLSEFVSIFYWTEVRDQDWNGESRLTQWAQFGWFPTEPLFGVCTSRLLVPRTQEDADELILGFLEKEPVLLWDEMQKTWGSDDYIFNNAVKCYEQGLYYAAGLCIFSGIEKEMGRFGKYEIKNGFSFFRKLLKKIELDRNSLYCPLKGGLSNRFEEMYAHFDPNSKEEQYPSAINRNRMCHGASRDLNEITVVQLFLFWNAFTNFLNQALINEIK